MEKDIEEIIAERAIESIDSIHANESQLEKANELFKHGLLFQLEGEFKQAIDPYTDVTVIHPEFYEPYYNMALCYEKLHRINDAIQHFEKAASLNTFYKPIFFKLGKLYSEQGNESKAAINWAIYNQM